MKLNKIIKGGLFRVEFNKDDSVDIIIADLNNWRSLFSFCHELGHVHHISTN